MNFELALVKCDCAKQMTSLSCTSTWPWTPGGSSSGTFHCVTQEHNPGSSFALLALCLDSATHSCFLSSLPLTSALPAGPRPAVSLRLSLSKVSREARCSRRIICPLMSGGSQYLPELKIHPSCVRLHTCAEGSPWRAGGSLQPDYWWRKNKLEPSLSSLGKQHTPQCASVAVMLMAHLESSLSGFLFQITPSSGLIFEDF